MAGGPLNKLLTVVLPKRKASKGGTASSDTFNPTATTAPLPIPSYQDHLTDIFTSRTSNDSRTLLKDLFRQDPDVSAAVNAYLTIADQPMMSFAYTPDGQIDPNGMKMLNQTMALLTKQFDYSLGYTYKPSLKTICENMRYMILLRGGIGAELVFDKNLSPSEIRNVDLATLQWTEPASGTFKPIQIVNGQTISLDVPTFFTAFFHRDPTDIYTYSSFVSAINTIAARQQVINDLYRIMQLTGYPRLDVSVLEEILVKNAPANVRNDPSELKTYLAARLNEVSKVVTNIRPDQAFVHFDSVEAKTMNDAKPAASLNIDSVISTLNAQNQAALKTMATIIGRGESGVNTASVESRVFSMNADALNNPIAEIFGHILSLALRLQGFQGYVECEFKKVELRPELELEAQLTMKQQRLLTLLSLGVINDDEFHIRMLGRTRPDSAPELAGTGFLAPPTPGQGGAPDASKASPNGDPLGRSLTSPGSKSAKSGVSQKKVQK